MRKLLRTFESKVLVEIKHNIFTSTEEFLQR